MGFPRFKVAPIAVACSIPLASPDTFRARPIVAALLVGNRTDNSFFWYGFPWPGFRRDGRGRSSAAPSCSGRLGPGDLQGDLPASADPGYAQPPFDWLGPWRRATFLRLRSSAAFADEERASYGAAESAAFFNWCQTSGAACARAFDLDELLALARRSARPALESSACSRCPGA